MGMNGREALRTFREGGVPVFALAEILRIERRALYALLDDQAADHPCLGRAAEILAAIRGGTGHGIRDVMRFREQRPRGGGETLREVLSREVVDPAAVAARLGELDGAIRHYMRFEASRRESQPMHGGNPILDEMPEVSLSPSCRVARE